MPSMPRRSNLQYNSLYPGFQVFSGYSEELPEGLYISINLKMKSCRLFDQSEQLDLRLDTSTGSAISLEFCKFWFRSCISQLGCCLS